MPYFWGEYEFPTSGNQLKRIWDTLHYALEYVPWECAFPVSWKSSCDWMSKQSWMDISFRFMDPISLQKKCCPSCRGIALKWWKIYHRQDNLKGRLNHGQLSAIGVWTLFVNLNFVWGRVCNVSSFSLSVNVERVDKLGLWVMPHYVTVLRIWMWEATILPGLWLRHPEHDTYI